MRTALIVLAILLCPLTGRAGPAEWMEQQKQCIAKCPKPKLTWRSGESEERWRKRMEQRRAYDECYMDCAREYMRHYRPGSTGGPSMIYRRPPRPPQNRP